MILVIPKDSGHFIDYKNWLLSSGKFNSHYCLSYPDDTLWIRLKRKAFFILKNLSKREKLFFLDGNENVVLMLLFFYKSNGIFYRLLYDKVFINFIVRNFTIPFLTIFQSQYVLNRSYREYINIHNTKLLSLDEFQSFIWRTGFDKAERFLLHYGSFTERKGTLQILRASAQSQTIRLVLIGTFHDDIREEAQSLMELSNGRVRHFKYHQDLLNSALSACSGIVALYSNNNQSSALVEMAISLGIPVAVINHGFLAYRVKEYRLGVLINNEELIQSSLEHMLLMNVQTSVRELNNINSCLAQIGLC